MPRLNISFCLRSLVSLLLVAAIGCAGEDAGKSDDPMVENNSCDEVDCSGHGMCDVVDGTATCDCEAGFVADGLRCVARAEGAPNVVSFTATPNRLTEGSATTLSATVLDEDGLDDIVSGRVVSAAEEASFGTLVKVGDGEYALEITWEEVHAITPIEFDGDAALELEALFVDRDGNEGRASLTLSVHCDDAGGAACGGTCVNLRTDPDNCGMCERIASRCADGRPACDDESKTYCGDPGSCVDVTANMDHCGDCDRACERPDLTHSTLIEDPECASGDCEFRLDFTSRATCEAQCVSEGLVCDTGARHLAVYGAGVYETEAVVELCSEEPFDSYASRDFTRMECACLLP